MSENTYGDLEKVLYDLELQILDLKAERSGNRIRLYFDTFDVEESISGFSRFYPNVRSFSERIFDSSKTLVHSLFTSGNLGKVHLLSPHKAELINRVRSLKSKFQYNFDTSARKFLSDTGFNDIDWQRAKDDESYRKHTINNLKPEEAQRFFRTVQNLFPWNKILEFIIKENRLVMKANSAKNEDKPGYIRIFKSDYYAELTRIIHSIRPVSTKNNLTDAISIGILIEKLNEWRQGNSRELPRFFASGDSILSLFLEADKDKLKEKVETHLRKNDRKARSVNRLTEDILQIQRHLNYFEDSLPHKPINVIRDENYFIFRSIYRSKDATLSERERINETIKRLEGWRDQIEEFLSVPEKVASRDWTRNLDKAERKEIREDVFSKNWVDVFGKRKDEFFFKEVWLKSDSLALQDFGNALEAVKAYGKFKEEWEKEFERTISENIDKTDNEAKQEIRDATMIVALANKLDTITKKNQLQDLRDLFSDEENLKRRFFNFFPIYRYFLPSDIYEEVIDLLKGIVEDNSISKSILLVNYAGLLEEDVSVSGPELGDKLDDKLALVTAVLYAIKAKRELWYLLERFVQMPLRFSFRIFLGELSLDKSLELKNFEHKDVTGRKKRAREIIEGLVKEFDFPDNELQLSNVKDSVKYKVGLAIGISILYYWRWKNDGGRSLWTKSQITDVEKKRQERKEDLIRRSIEYANKAFEICGDSEAIKAEKYYALNLGLFFSVISNDMSSGTRIRIDADAKNLMDVEDENVWQFRYDDTIARYFCKIVMVHTEDPVQQEAALEIIDYWFEKAKQSSKNDEFVKETRSIIIEIKKRIHLAKTVIV